MRARDPFGQALTALRRAVRDGLAPGQHLPIADIAGQLRLSTSPVREALSRLCGEGLIEDRRGLGYFTHGVSTEELVGLFQLEEAYLRLARELSTNGVDLSGSDDDLDKGIAAMFADCDNDPLKDAFDRLQDRLAPIRALDRDDQPPSEFGSLADYHAHWFAAVPRLSKRLRRLGPADIENITNTV
jgi:DNA-binding transcriptional regulator YhcF (GntR family)